MVRINMTLDDLFKKVLISSIAVFAAKEIPKLYKQGTVNKC